MKLRSFITLALAVCVAFPAGAQKKYVAEKLEKCDPYMTLQGGYGYLIKKTPKADVWWAEGCYKVMKDTPVAKRRAGSVKLSSAQNEYESFIVVVNPKQELKNLKVEVSGLPADIEVTIRKTEYVNIFYNSDSFGFPGQWPDPLPLYEAPADAPAGENTSFWITLKTPAGHAASYSGRVTLSDDGGWKVSMPVSVKVRNFELPQRPSCNADMGLWFWEVVEYENLKTEEQKQESYDNYIQAFKDYRIQVRDPFYRTPVKYNFSQTTWTGGCYDSRYAREGKYSYMLEDPSASRNTEGFYARKFIPVDSSHSYKVSAWVRSDTLVYTHILVDSYDADKKLIPFRAAFQWVDTGKEWTEYFVDLDRLDPRTKYLHIRIFGGGACRGGEETGTTWWDDVRLTDLATGENLFPEGNFEVDPEAITVDIDFTEFAKAAKKYYADDSFRYFTIPIAGIGDVNFDNSRLGSLCGFLQGSPEYEMLMGKSLNKLQSGLKELGMLDKAYVYWGDEPNPPAYPVLYDTHRLLKKYAPGIKTFMTEMSTWRGHATDSLDISDCTDISCVSWDCFENHDIIKNYQVPGKEAWNYLCCGTKYPYFSNFIDHNAIDMRIWLWASYQFGFKGILIWASTAWNSTTVSPAGTLQNQWEEPYCFSSSHQMIQRLLACGDGTLFYPHNRKPNEDKTTAYTGYPIPCVRLEILRDGIEDFEYLTMLEERIPRMSASDAAKARNLLVLPKEAYQDDSLEDPEAYTIQDPQILIQRRDQIAALLEKYR